jgi:hypothetical protein
MTQTPRPTQNITQIPPLLSPTLSLAHLSFDLYIHILAMMLAQFVGRSIVNNNVDYSFLLADMS